MNETMGAVGWRRRILATTAFFTFSSVACSSPDIVSTPKYGFIRVTVVSTGGDLDADGYSLVVDAQQVAKLQINQTLGSFFVPPGAHAVTLQNVAENCVVQGSNVRTVSVETDVVTDVNFVVDCKATGIAVTTRTTGVGAPETLMLWVSGLSPTRTIASSGSNTFSRLTAGSYVLILTVPPHCIISGGEQVIVNVTSGVTTPVTFDVACSAFTRSDKIAFVDDRTVGSDVNRFLTLVNPDGTGRTILRAGESPSWSPDRTRLAFSTTRCDDDDYYYYYYYGPFCTGGIQLIDAETWDVTPTRGGYAYEPSWAPTGGALVLEGFGARGRGTTMKLHVLQLSSGTLSLLDIKGPESNEQPAWSPDGTRIAFACRWFLNTDLCIVNADGSNLVRVTNDAPADLHPAWSPSGNGIAFARHPFGRTDPASGEIVVIDLATSAVKVLTTGTEPTWSSDGSRLAFAGADGLFVIGADGTNLKRLTTGNHRAPAWRP